MNVVDSSAWLEYFADGPNAAAFAKPIESPATLLVPTLSLFEVFKRICQQRDEEAALRAVAMMEQGRVVDLDRATALEAARLSLAHSVPMADSIILVAAGYSASGNYGPLLGWSAALFAVITAYVRTLGASSGAGQSYQFAHS